MLEAMDSLSTDIRIPILCHPYGTNCHRVMKLWDCGGHLPAQILGVEEADLLLMEVAKGFIV